MIDLMVVVDGRRWRVAYDITPTGWIVRCDGIQTELFGFATFSEAVKAIQQKIREKEAERGSH